MNNNHPTPTKHCREKLVPSPTHQKRLYWVVPTPPPGWFLRHLSGETGLSLPPAVISAEKLSEEPYRDSGLYQVPSAIPSPGEWAELRWGAVSKHPSFSLPDQYSFNKQLLSWNEWKIGKMWQSRDSQQRKEPHGNFVAKIYHNWNFKQTNKQKTLSG